MALKKQYKNKYKAKLPIEGARRSELLMPAGSLEKLKFAVLYGADAVYMGTPDMCMRVKSKFSLEEVIEGVNFCHEHGARAYLTLNLIAHNRDLDKLPEYIETIRTVKPDGVIIADPGVFNYVRQHAPELSLHVSTQANVTNWMTVKYWQDQGADLVVMARDVSYEELREVREKCPDIMIEQFVHGSMCMTYSGRCMLSNFLSERGANQGSCTNSCRWNYKLHIKLKDGTVQELEINDDNKDLFDFFLEEKFRPGELMPFEEDMRGSYILNSKDLCIMPRLDDYLSIGIDSLKVEGRGKSAYYAGVVARAYRMAIDAYYEDPENWDPRHYMAELDTVGNRGYTLAFHEGRLKNISHNYEHTSTIAEWEFAGIVREVTEDAFLLEIKNKLSAGDVLEFVPPKCAETYLIRCYEYEDMKTGKVTEEIHAGYQPVVRIPFSNFDHESLGEIKKNITPYTLIRKESSLTKAEWERIKLDTVAQKIELKQAPDDLYEGRLEKLQNAIDADETGRQIKSPRFGVEGCCARGCNGCRVFWDDPKYEKARALLAERKQGALLSSAEALEAKDIARNLEKEENDTKEKAA
ncbi:MAG: U32 family peptidase C-terminal domain-containing protein [Pseudomonadota bacterium]|nr:U32 family peptidase C-terminal domain-containing protein [Pseudomonadota bacterium]